MLKCSYMKEQNDLQIEEGYMQASANDVLGVLGPMTKEEYEYYMNIPDPDQ